MPERGGGDSGGREEFSWFWRMRAERNKLVLEVVGVVQSEVKHMFEGRCQVESRIEVAALDGRHAADAVSHLG